MKNTDLHDAIGEIDESIIADVAEKRAARRTNRYANALKYASVAACVCVVVLGAVLLGLGPMMDDESPINIPAGDTICTLPEDSVQSNIEPNLDVPPQSLADLISVDNRELTNGYTLSDFIYDKVSPADYSITYADFSLDLFRAVIKGEGNEMISPLSALYAITMCANSVEGDSLKQIEDTVGMSLDEMNRFVRSYMDSIPFGDRDSLKIANSLWINYAQELKVDPEYLSKINNYMSAQAYSYPFDSEIIGHIDNWISEKTDGMITKISDMVPNDAYLYLVNAISFDAKWATLEEHRNKWTFTLEDGTEKLCDCYLSGGTSDGYLEDDDTVGFIYKYSKNYFDYENRAFAFVALMPKNDISIGDYVNSLSGEKIHSLLKNKDCNYTDITFPAFSSEYCGYLDEPLKELGITDIFDPAKIQLNAFKLTTGEPLFYGRPLHKTFIEVSSQGTKASADTVFPIPQGSFDKIVVTVDRPFVYMIVDCENGIPLFLGTVMDPTN